MQGCCSYNLILGNTGVKVLSPKIERGLICFHASTGCGISSVSTQAQTKSMVLNRIKHLQVRATSRSINNAAIIKFGSYERAIQVKQCFWSAPQEVCDRTRSKFRTFVHLSFTCFMCGMKDSLRSKTTPRNLVSSTTGTGVPFSRRDWFWVGFAQFTKVYAYGFRRRELESIGVSPV